MRIVYMGTPEFAVMPLDKILKAGHEVVAVVTVSDKPSGRGLVMNESAVKKYALSSNCCLLQPAKLKDADFINHLQSLQAELFVVVAFRMLPKEMWAMPPKGCINLHASLLPQYRGAAPINHVIINGEKTTGVTTFFINENIDTGNIIHRKEVNIDDNDDAGSLHDKLMEEGSLLLLKTIHDIEHNNVCTIKQTDITESGTTLKTSPKINKETCSINWNNNAESIQNLIRGLSPYPGAFSLLADNSANSKICKIFKSKYIVENHQYVPGTIISDDRSFVKVAALNGFIELISIQLEGKKRMDITDFLKGNRISPLKFI